MKTTIWAIVVISTLFASCAPSRFVKPLKKNEQAAGFSFGGPMIKFSGLPIPIPFSTLVYGYGLTDNVTGYAGLHTTSLLFGNIQSDLGATLKLFEKAQKAGLSVSPAVQLAYNFGNQTSFRAWPTVDLNGWYHLKSRSSYVYAGIETWFELSKVRAHFETQQQHALPDFHAGYTLVGEKWRHQFQVAYYVPGIPVYPGVVDYIGISQKGALGFHYAIFRTF
jgi:hypothetical protein